MDEVAPVSRLEDVSTPSLLGTGAHFIHAFRARLRPSMDPRCVADHYAVPELGARVLAALAAAGHDPEALSVEDLAPFDAFHTRGRAATEELAAEVALDAGARVLDVGCGIGGTSRFLAARAGCHVTGIDLTEEFVRTAELLSVRTGLAERTAFRRASALELPFEARSFDVVWTEHVQMNVADKARFYGEIARVLRPGGRLAFHDLFAGPATSPLAFPVPWASHAGLSHLVAPEAARALLAALGFEALHWLDVTALARDFFARAAGAPPRPLGLQLLMGDSTREKLGNVLANLEADRLRVVRAVLARP